MGVSFGTFFGPNSLGAAINAPPGMGPGSNPDTSQYQGMNLNSFGNSPYTSALQSSLASMPQFQPLSQSSYGSAYQAKDISSKPLPQYDAMRQRLNSQYSQVQDQGQNSIDRQFAAMGGGPGNGAQVKQTENLASGVAQQKDSDLQNLNFQEANTQTQLQQQQDQMAFQSNEALQGRQFQGAQFNSQGQMQQNQFNFGAQTSIDQLNQGWQQAQLDANTTNFNEAMANFQAQHSGGLLGAGGFLGTGGGTGMSI